MAPHKKTNSTDVFLALWDGVKVVNSGCTYFYYEDIIINSLRPNYISTKANENDVVIQVRGLFFRNDDFSKNSFQIRVGNDLVLDQSQVNFFNSTFVTFKAPNFREPGPRAVFFSNNYGISWTDGNRAKDLYYHHPIQVHYLSLDKI
jgi:hypothetical protein